MLDIEKFKNSFLLKNLYSEDIKMFLELRIFDRCIIYLEIEVEDGTAKEVFLHELTHVALEMVGLGGSEDSDLIPHIFYA